MIWGSVLAATELVAFARKHLLPEHFEKRRYK
jgi:hypothetical protein